MTAVMYGTMPRAEYQRVEVFDVFTLPVEEKPRVLNAIWLVCSQEECSKLAGRLERLEIVLGEQPQISIPIYLLGAAWISCMHASKRGPLRYPIRIPARQSLTLKLVDEVKQIGLGRRRGVRYPRFFELSFTSRVGY